ncbi:MAG TPA: hypothetical protein DCX14_03830 [Flavobacteriales bacterium]|nr:hypothetical protein [Flavobacteriales bacterium]
MRGYLILLFTLYATISTAQYFQQDVAYNIRVKLDDQKMMLTGSEEVVYTNNSPDTLEFIYFHLWPNAYKNRQTALAKQLIRMKETSLHFAADDDKGYIDSLAFALNGKLCLWEYDEEHIDIAKIYLEDPLPPKGQVNITTPFRVKIPNGNISRLGHVGESFQITQWYPKPAVYDTAGWHQMPYLTQGEFYSEFGSFDVFIEIPKNYVVGATGDLQTVSEVEWLGKKVEETEAWIADTAGQESGPGITKDMSFPESDAEFKTLHYHQEKVHDFGWFADKRYHVLKGAVGLPNSTDSVDIWTMFTNKRAKLWMNSLEYMHDAVYYYSLWNGNYPYKHATAVDGTISAGGGMEYPNVTVIGDPGDELTLETVIMHEVGHNWFYGILGSNEREFPWLDEGINSYNEQRYLGTKYPNGTIQSKTGNNKLLEFIGLDKYRMNEQHYLTYLTMARTNKDQPMNVASPDYSLLNYGFIVYSKSATTLNHLRHYLGDSTMDAGMHRYFEDNKFKHPYPKSFENALETTSGENLDWFFKDVVQSKEKIDYGIKSVKTNESGTIVRLKNRGLVVPIPVSIVDENDSVIETKWIKGFDRDTTIHFSSSGSRVAIDHGRLVPESIRDNNYSKSKGLLKRTEPINLRLLGAVEDPTVNRIYYVPILGMNVPNGLMPGVMLYNHLVPARKFSYALLPMFATKGQKVVGTGILSYSIQPTNSALENIEITLSGKRYITHRTADNNFIYNRIHPHVEFYLRPQHYDGLVSQQFGLGSVVNVLQTPFLEANGEWTTNTFTEQFNRIHYLLKYDHPVYASKVHVKAEHHTSFVRSSLEFRERINIDKKVRIDARLFGGAFLANNTVHPKYNWRMDGQSASTDYAFDGEYFDRSSQSNLFSRQFSENHGGFKVPTAVGQSSRWITALNVKARFGKIPVGVFADVGVSESESFMYDAGLYLSVVPNVIEVYLPLLYSKSIENNLTANGLTWTDLIRFQIGIDRVNLFEKMKRLDVL